MGPLEGGWWCEDDCPSAESGATCHGDLGEVPNWEGRAWGLWMSKLSGEKGVPPPPADPGLKLWSVGGGGWALRDLRDGGVCPASRGSDWEVDSGLLSELAKARIGYWRL